MKTHPNYPFRTHWRKTLLGFAPALAAVLVAFDVQAAIFADSVVNYDHGTGFATEFSPPHLGYTNPAVALGQPNADSGFGPVTPFNPPFLRSEIVSLGLNGSLTVSFLTPIQNHPGNPFGLDFIIYGSAGFIDADYPNGRTYPDAALFSNDAMATRVSVSSDGTNFYLLNPLLAPVLDALFPTDSEGTFGVPVNPALGPADLGDKSFAEIRALYNGSAGGAGFDLSWAVDEFNLPVNLASISQIRVDVLDGRAEIDGFAAVLVPEPASWSLFLAGAGLLWRRRRAR